MAAKKPTRKTAKKGSPAKKAVAKPAAKKAAKKPAKKTAVKQAAKKTAKAVTKKVKSAKKSVKRAVKKAAPKSKASPAKKKPASGGKTAKKASSPKKIAARKPVKPAPKKVTAAKAVSLPARTRVTPADERANSRVRDRGDIQNLNRDGGRTRSGDDEVRGLHAEEDNEFSLRGTAPENRHQPRNPSVGTTAEGPEDEENIYGNDAGGLALGGELDDPSVTADLGPNSIRDIEDELNLDFVDEGGTLPDDDLLTPSRNERRNP